MNTWWVRSLVCLCADQFVENLLESTGAAVKRLRLEERNRTSMSEWTLEYLDRLWNHVEMKKCLQQQFNQRFQRHLRQNLTVKPPNREDQECMQKHSGSERSGLNSAERLNVLHAKPPDRESLTLEKAKRIRMPGQRVAKPRKWRRRRGELLRIRIHDH